jgi:nanoRNase/pAp phosphatase (c-di-AMP/oligoRNAs hydrolase)
MELSIQEQIFDQVRKANKILIALPEALTADSLASGLALKLFLQKLRKDAELFSSGVLPDSLKFLPGSDSVKSEIASGQSLVITLDTTQKNLDEISYQIAEGKAQIFLKSRGQPFAEEDLSFATDKFPLDLIVTLDAVSLESLGQLFQNRTDLFYQTPKISIDHKAGNEYFGAINLVDLAASSVAEILAGLLEQFEAELLDEDIATCLLAGIITKTNSFQHSQTTPQAFLKASKLVNLGGRQQEIIRHIYKTKSLGMLKLWGRVLARLKSAEDFSLIYSVLNETDFEKSEAGEGEVIPALKELLDNVSGYNLAAILSQTRGGVRVVLAAHASANVAPVLDSLQAPAKPALIVGQYQVFDFVLPNLSITDAENRFLEAAKSASA